MPIRMTDDPAESDDSGGGFEGDEGRGGGGRRRIIRFASTDIRTYKRAEKSSAYSRARLLRVIFYLAVVEDVTWRHLPNRFSNWPREVFWIQRQFDKSKVYESLSDDDNKNPLPESANLQKYAPAVGDQGKQGSCVAWSSAYGARTILESVRTGSDPNSLKFSPAFLYNQIGLGWL